MHQMNWKAEKSAMNRSKLLMCHCLSHQGVPISRKHFWDRRGDQDWLLDFWSASCTVCDFSCIRNGLLRAFSLGTEPPVPRILVAISSMFTLARRRCIGFCSAQAGFQDISSHLFVVLSSWLHTRNSQTTYCWYAYVLKHMWELWPTLTRERTLVSTSEICWLVFANSIWISEYRLIRSQN